MIHGGPRSAKSWVCVVGVATRLRGGRSGFRIQAGKIDFSLLRSSPHCLWSPLRFLFSDTGVLSRPVCKVNLRFVASFRMNGSISVFQPNAFMTWTGSMPFYFYQAESICLNTSVMTAKIDWAQVMFFKNIKFCLNKFSLRRMYNVTTRRVRASIVAVGKQ
jgi:hypothetical protein